MTQYTLIFQKMRSRYNTHIKAQGDIIHARKKAVGIFNEYDVESVSKVASNIGKKGFPEGYKMVGIFDSKGTTFLGVVFKTPSGRYLWGKNVGGKRIYYYMTEGGYVSGRASTFYDHLLNKGKWRD